jgi:CarD family transcriptional regulator
MNKNSKSKIATSRMHARTAPAQTVPVRTASPKPGSPRPAAAKTGSAKIAVAKAPAVKSLAGKPQAVAKGVPVKAVPKAPAVLAIMPKIQVAPTRMPGKPNGSHRGSSKIVSGPQASEIAADIANGAIRTFSKPVKRNGFSAGDYVVYPTHGVGKITGIEERSLAGASLNLLVVNFEKDRMTLRVPVNKVETSGMRKLSSREKMRSALTVLKGRARVKRTMWSRRAQEYEAKINSGDPESIAEVVRDLHGRVGQPDQSYSERQLYEAALDRLVRELAAVERIEPDKAVDFVNRQLKIA